MMRKPWLLAALILGGCGGGAQVQGPAPAPKPAAAMAVKAPDIEARTHLALIHNGKSLGVGASAEDAEQTFPRPPNASSFKDLPPGFEEPYRARGWETVTQGFGAVFYENRIVGAMFHENTLSQTEVDLTLQSYEATFGKAKYAFEGARSRYYFWESRPHRLMLFALRDKETIRYELTLAIGDTVVMDALRMSPVHAREDRLAVEAKPTVGHPG